MAALEELDKIVNRHGSQKAPEKEIVSGERRPRLMQHAHIRNEEEDVKFSGQKKHHYAQSGGNKSNVSTSQNDKQANAIDGQTQVIKTQALAQQRQSNILVQQSGLMQDQLQATREVSDVVERLMEYMKREATKPVPKVQESRGNTYEGEFTRVDDKKNIAAERQRSLLEEMREKRREIRRQRAGRQPRDERGRFKRGPKVQRIGGGGMGGRLAGLGGRMLGGAALPLATLAVALFGGSVMNAMRDRYTFEKKDSNMVERGWQNTKDWVGDKFRSDPGESTLDKLTAKSHATSVARGQKAATDSQLGSISAEFESGGKVDAVSTGKGDHGGVSYGKHQLSSKTGSMTNFLRSEEGSKYYNEFRGLKPGTEEFNNKYKEVAGRDKEGMEKAQRAFIKRANYDPVSAWFQKQYDVNLDERARAVREAVYSVATQYGPSTGKSVLADAFGNRDITKMSDAEMIDRIQETRANTVNERFRSSSDDVRAGIYKRAGEEKTALMAMLNEEKQGPGSAAQAGSGIGAQYSQQMIGVYGGQKGGGASQPTGASNGTVGVMAMQGGGGGGTPSSDEAGGGTAAELAPGGGALYVLGQKHVKLNSSSVNMSGLNPNFKQAFYTMVGDWVQNFNGTVCNVESAFRTRAEQEALWIKYGRNTKRVARPGTSRHESGFAIDIDRKSAQAMESAGLFKKYGFHRPLSNEPWHVEMIRGAGKKGGVETEAAAVSPQVMQQAAVKEMDKAAEATVARAEENTKGAAAQGAVPGGKPPSDSETGGVSTAAEKTAKEALKGVEEEEEEEEVDEKVESPEPGDEVKDFKKETPPPAVDVMGGQEVIRTPEEQALYEQYLKKANGDPRNIPPAVAGDPGSKNPFAGLEQPGSGVTTSTQNMPVRRIGEQRVGTPAGTARPSYGQRVQPYSRTQSGRAITGAATKIGRVYGMGSFGTMLPGVDKVLKGADGKVNEVLNKVPGLRELSRLPGMPRIPRLSQGLPSFGNIVTGAADKIAGLFGDDDAAPAPQAPQRTKVVNGQRITYEGPAITSTDQIGAPSSLVPQTAPSTSPASPNYYNQETAVVSRAAGSTSPMSIAPSVSATPSAAPVERNPFNSVQEVSLSPDSMPQQTAAAPAPGGGGGGGGGGRPPKNDMPQLDDVSPIVNDLGILFPLSGYV